MPAIFNYARLLDVGRGDRTAAARQYRRVLRRDANHSNANLGVAGIMAAQGKRAKADELYLRAVQADSSNAVAAFNYASFLEREMGSYERALPYYFQSTVIKPNHELFNKTYLR